MDIPPYSSDINAYSIVYPTAQCDVCSRHDGGLCTAAGALQCYISMLGSRAREARKRTQCDLSAGGVANGGISVPVPAVNPAAKAASSRHPGFPQLCGNVSKVTFRPVSPVIQHCIDFCIFSFLL